MGGRSLCILRHVVKEVKIRPSGLCDSRVHHQHAQAPARNYLQEARASCDPCYPQVRHPDDGHLGCARAPATKQGCVEQRCEEHPAPCTCALRAPPQRRRGCQGETLHHCDPCDGRHHCTEEGLPVSFDLCC